MRCGARRSRGFGCWPITGLASAVALGRGGDARAAALPVPGRLPGAAGVRAVDRGRWLVVADGDTLGQRAPRFGAGDRAWPGRPGLRADRRRPAVLLGESGGVGAA